jgi:multimeric flavodoxin WrbA
MKITVFNGSPKAERGNTHFIAEAFLEGAREAGAEGETVFIVKKKIKPCTGCYTCWMKTPGKCAQQDDMEELIGTFISSDIVVFATPLYVDNVTGLMKNFMDRLIPIADPHWEKDENGESRHLRRYEKPTRFVVISNCGFPEQSHFQVLRLYFRRVGRNLSGAVIAEIYRGGGAILTSSEPSLKSFIESYRQLVRKAGKEVAERLTLSAETAAQLERPLVPVGNFADEYMRRANERCDEILSKLNTKHGGK